MFVGFIGGRWIHTGALGIVGFIEGRWGHALGVDVFILGSSHPPCGLWVYSGTLSDALGVYRVRWVPMRVWVSKILTGDFGFTRTRPGCRWVLLGSLGSLTPTVVVDAFIWGRWVHSLPPLGLRIHSG